MFTGGYDLAFDPWHPMAIYVAGLGLFVLGWTPTHKAAGTFAQHHVDSLDLEAGPLDRRESARVRAAAVSGFLWSTRV